MENRKSRYERFKFDFNSADDNRRSNVEQCLKSGCNMYYYIPLGEWFGESSNNKQDFIAREYCPSHQI
jgi:hypothetical protein